MRLSLRADFWATVCSQSLNASLGSDEDTYYTRCPFFRYLPVSSPQNKTTNSERGMNFSVGVSVPLPPSFIQPFSLVECEQITSMFPNEKKKKKGFSFFFFHLSFQQRENLRLQLSYRFLQEENKVMQSKQTGTPASVFC